MTYNHTHKIYLDLSFVCNQLVCITSCFVDLTYPLDFPKVADPKSLKDPPFCERKPCNTTWHSTNPDPPQPSIKIDNIKTKWLTVFRDTILPRLYTRTVFSFCKISLSDPGSWSNFAGLTKLHVACKRTLLTVQASKIEAKHIFKCKKSFENIFFWQHWAQCPFSLVQHCLW